MCPFICTNKVFSASKTEVKLKTKIKHKNLVITKNRKTKPRQ